MLIFIYYNEEKKKKNACCTLIFHVKHSQKTELQATFMSQGSRNLETNRFFPSFVQMQSRSVSTSFSFIDLFCGWSNTHKLMVSMGIMGIRQAVYVPLGEWQNNKHTTDRFHHWNTPKKKRHTEVYGVCQPPPPTSVEYILKFIKAAVGIELMTLGARTHLYF